MVMATICGSRSPATVAASLAIFRYTDRTTKREHFMGLGPLNTINLDEARELAVANRKLLRDGKDPMTERDARQLDDKIERGLAKTVSQVADEYFEAKIAHKSPAYRSETARYLKRVRDTIGDVPI